MNKIKKKAWHSQIPQIQFPLLVAWHLYLSPLDLSAETKACLSAVFVTGCHCDLCAWRWLTERRWVTGPAERVMINHHTLWFIFHHRQPLCACCAAPIRMQITAMSLADPCPGLRRFKQSPQGCAFGKDVVKWGVFLFNLGKSWRSRRCWSCWSNGPEGEWLSFFSPFI